MVLDIYDTTITLADDRLDFEVEDLPLKEEWDRIGASGFQGSHQSMVLVECKAAANGSLTVLWRAQPLQSVLDVLLRKQ